MPPKVKILKNDIVDAAVSLVRERGEDALNARSIAEELNCSTQPIFSNFATMEELRLAVIDAADAMYMEYTEREVASGKYPPYKASGMAYIRFAKEERELFKLLYMRDRTTEVIPKETALGNSMEEYVHDNTGLRGDSARLFHLEIWTCVHGIATMLATGFLDIDEELISKMITDCYNGLKNRFEVE